MHRVFAAGRVPVNPRQAARLSGLPPPGLAIPVVPLDAPPRFDGYVDRLIGKTLENRGKTKENLREIKQHLGKKKQSTNNKGTRRKNYEKPMKKQRTTLEHYEDLGKTTEAQ